MKKYILFIPHTPLQVDMAYNWADASKELGYNVICLLLYNRLKNLFPKDYHQFFDHVVSLQSLMETTDEKAFEKKVAYVRNFERKHNECKFSKDWSIDRTFQLMNLQYEDSINLTYYWLIALERLFKEYDITYAVSEKLFLPQRIVHYLLGEKGGKHLYPIGDRFFDRFYFEDNLDWNWNQAVEIYKNSDQKFIERDSEITHTYYSIVNKGEKKILDKHNKAKITGKIRIGSIKSVPKKIIKRKYQQESIYETFLTQSNTESLFVKLSNKIKQYNNLKFYKKIISSNIPSEDFVLFLFHFQPEYTVDALASDYTNQAEFVIRIAKHLPSHIRLVVKENPLSVGRLNRFPAYYRSLLRQPNIILIDHNIDSHQLIKKAKCVITLTGTVGIESILFGTPVIVFGRIFYRQFNLATEAKTFEEGINGIINVVNSNNEFSKEEIKKNGIQVLAAIYWASYKGKMFNAFHPNDHRTSSNIENLKNALKSYIEDSEK